MSPNIFGIEIESLTHSYSIQIQKSVKEYLLMFYRHETIETNSFAPLYFKVVVSYRIFFLEMSVNFERTFYNFHFHQKTVKILKFDVTKKTTENVQFKSR